MTPLAPGSELGGFVVDAWVQDSGPTALYRVHAAAGTPDPGFPLLMMCARPPADEAGPARLRHEVEHLVLARLAGPQVPRLVAASAPAQSAWLVMEEVPGRNLQEWLDAPDRPAGDEVVRLAVAVAQAVHELHRQHVVHHDLQPAHVRIRPDGSAVLLGFGQAFHAQLPDLLAGAPAPPAASAGWVAPEQLLGQRGDPRSDIFAIGVMLYQLLSGELPFGAPSSRAGLRRRLWRAPPPLEQRQPLVPPWLQEVVGRCLAPVAAQRYPTAAHLAFDLLHPQPVRETVPDLAHWSRVLWTGCRRWLWAARLLDAPGGPPARGAAAAPIVMLAVAPPELADALPEALRQAAQRALGSDPFARLVCVCVMAPAAQGAASAGDDAGAAPSNSAPRQLLGRLRRWARPLGEPGREAVCKLLQADDAAQALLNEAAAHHVSEIVLAAPAPAGAAAAQVVASRVALTAPCTVQLVRLPGRY